MQLNFDTGKKSLWENVNLVKLWNWGGEESSGCGSNFCLSTDVRNLYVPLRGYNPQHKPYAV